MPRYPSAQVYECPGAMTAPEEHLAMPLQAPFLCPIPFVASPFLCPIKLELKEIMRIRVEAENQPPASLAPYLCAWWKAYWPRETTVTCATFLSRLTVWLQEEGYVFCSWLTGV